MILFIQPWDKPWTAPWYVARRKAMYMSRAQFEVGFQVPKEFSLRFLDLNLCLKEGLTVKQAVRAELRTAKPEVVLISWPTYVLGGQIKTIVDVIAAECPGIPVVIGGSAISLIHERPLRDWAPVTACYYGNGWEIPELVRRIIRGQSVAGLPGSFDRTCSGEVPPWKADLVDGYDPKELYTAANRFDFSGYVQRCRSANVEPMGIIEMSRGCKFRCGFCAINRNRIGFQTRAPETVIREARFLAGYGILRQHLIDPTLGLTPKAETEALLCGLADVANEFPGFSLEVLTRPEFVDEWLVGLLRAASVRRCAIGMETMERKDLLQVSKNLQPSATERAVWKLTEAGIETKLFHILFPGRVSWDTIQSLSALMRKGARFVMQSSFLHQLEHPESDMKYLQHDQTVFTPERDDVHQLMEWMAVNLAFPSMDVSPKGDADVLDIVTTAKKESELRGLFQAKKCGRELWFATGKKRYGYVHPHPSRPQAVADCLFVE